MTIPDAAETRAFTERLRLLAQPQRLLILSLLLEGTMAVSDIESRSEIGQPTLSQQLGALRRAGLVSARRDSRSMYYSFASAAERDRFRRLLDLLRGRPERAEAVAVRASGERAPVSHFSVRPRGSVEDGGARFARVLPPAGRVES